MSEVLEAGSFIIDTGAVVESQQPRVEPLPLYDEHHPMLRVQIPEYTNKLPNHNMELLIKRLKMTMKLYGGVGLSANQCGVFERVFVIGHEEFSIACINPKIVGKSPSTAKDQEGCLSFPGFFVKIDRPDWVDVEYTDENGQVVQQRLEGVTARCFQHELDHMNGVRFTDHVGPVAMQQARRKQEKLIKKIVRHKKK